MTRPELAAKAASCPRQPGVYYHKDQAGQIIYVGKASDLRRRLGSYFRRRPGNDAKLQALIGAIADFDYSPLASEIDALFYEAEMIRRYRPVYNVLGRDQINNGLYIRLWRRGPNPNLSLTYQPAADGADYYGPYLARTAVRQALRYMRPIFPYSTHNRLPKRACLHYHIGLCPGPETANFDRAAALANLDDLGAYIRGQRNHIVKRLQERMEAASARLDYETAARQRNQLRSLAGLSRRAIFADDKTIDLVTDQSLVDLSQFLGLETIPARIEAIDVSHQSGQNSVASLVVFKNGVAARTDYRRFRLKLVGNNDVGHINEVVGRRLRPGNRRRWGSPNLLLIDGGKGQVAGAIAALPADLKSLPVIGLAKKQELVIGQKGQTSPKPRVGRRLGVKLASTAKFWQAEWPPTSPGLLLLRQIRDESHRFAQSYHSLLKRRRQTVTSLTKIAGVGPARERLLWQSFSSQDQIRSASVAELATVVGPSLAQKIYDHYRPSAAD